MNHITLFDQNKLVLQKLDAIMNSELVVKQPKILIIIVSLKFYFTVAVRVALLTTYIN